MPLEDLKVLADSGAIQALDYVRSATSGDWVAAGNIEELGLSSATVEASCYHHQMIDVVAPGPLHVTEIARKQELDDIISRYPQKRAALLPALWMVQQERGWISEDAMREVGDRMTLMLDPACELRTFAEVMDRIKAAYVEPVDDKALLENAIKGMLSNLDPHSAYLEPDAFAELQESTSGEFGGLGIEVGVEDGFIKVVSPIDDSPASRAGIKAGDLIA